MNADIELLVNTLLKGGLTYERAIEEAKALYQTAYERGFQDGRKLSKRYERIDVKNPIIEIHKRPTGVDSGVIYSNERQFDNPEKIEEI